MRPAQRMAGELPSYPTHMWPASCEWQWEHGSCSHAEPQCDLWPVPGRWLDKLGLAAQRGIDVVMRQVFFGAGSYHLVDGSFKPLPVRT